MKGDFSRETFEKENHYSAVLRQQGRVDVEADWNEQQAINRHRIRTETRDVIGECCAPADNPGFEITTDGKTLKIGKGRLYVNGILCENESDVDYQGQPDLPFKERGEELLDVPELLKDAPAAIVYLDVWDRHITALDDPHIREKALGGPDTTTRLRTVWQVRVLSITTPPNDLSCESKLDEWADLIAERTGQMNARAKPSEDKEGPCIIPPSSGYRRLENQLYRVEIHQPGVQGKATFKWSRDNGTVVTAIKGISGKEVTVHDVGRDEVLGFASGQWVELTDDWLELNGQPGELIRIAKVYPDTRVITLEDAPKLSYDEARHRKLRRWDGAGDLEVEVPAANDGWIRLEGGVEVQFSENKKETYKTGDYWLIPARTATGNIEWPLTDPSDTKSDPLPQSPLGIQHHFCRLAVIKLAEAEVNPDNVDTGERTITDAIDCRCRFSPLCGQGPRETREEPVPAIHILKAQVLQAAFETRKRPEVVITDFESIQVVFDAAIDKTIFKDFTPQPICYVSLDLPCSFDGNNNSLKLLGTPVVGFQPFILDGGVAVAVNGESLRWKRKGSTDRFMKFLVEEDQEILARFTLKGNFIWGDKDERDQRRYLDGDAFGNPEATDGNILIMPSGDGRRGGDFEMWFWLTPPQ